VDMSSLTVTFTVECSKGTYIRTICQDVGIALGTGAVMTSLVRTKSGGFAIEDALTLEQLAAIKEAAGGEEADDSWIDQVLLPVDMPLIHFGRAVVSAELGKKFVDGWHIALRDCRIEAYPEYSDRNAEMEIREEYRRAWNLYQEAEGQDGAPPELQFLGVAFYDRKYKKLVADKVFFRLQSEDTKNENL